MPGLPIHRDKRPLRFQRPMKILSEHFFLVAIVAGVHLPNRRVLCRCEQTFPVTGHQRPKFKKIANEVRLQINLHNFGVRL